MKNLLATIVLSALFVAALPYGSSSQDLAKRVDKPADQAQQLVEDTHGCDIQFKYSVFPTGGWSKATYADVKRFKIGGALTTDVSEITILSFIKYKKSTTLPIFPRGSSVFQLEPAVQTILEYSTGGPGSVCSRLEISPKEIDKLRSGEEGDEEQFFLTYLALSTDVGNSNRGLDSLRPFDITTVNHKEGLYQSTIFDTLPDDHVIPIWPYALDVLFFEECTNKSTSACDSRKRPGDLLNMLMDPEPREFTTVAIATATSDTARWSHKDQFSKVLDTCSHSPVFFSNPDKIDEPAWIVSKREPDTPSGEGRWRMDLVTSLDHQEQSKVFTLDDIRNTILPNYPHIVYNATQLF